MANVLLTVSGTKASPDIAERIERGLNRRIDYMEMAHTFPADICDYHDAQRVGGLLGRLLGRVNKNLMLVWACFRQRKTYQVIVTDGEQIGIPLALLFKLVNVIQKCRPRLMMLTHDPLVRKKRLFFQNLRVQSHIDRLFVFSTRHQQYFENHWNVAKGQVIYTPFMVDARFFDPARVQPTQLERPQICSVGLEARDYPTLMKAVEGLDVDMVIAASSPWAKHGDSSQAQTIPANVRVDRDPKCDVRQLYANSAFSIMPLMNVDRAAGSTSILEAMAMGKAVICTRLPYQSELVVDGETGLYVPPSDPAALRAAIVRLLEHPDEAKRMGKAGRRRVEEALNLDTYVQLLNTHVQAYLAQACSSSVQPSAAVPK